MKHGNGLPDWIRKFGSIVLLLLAGSICARSQEPSAPAESQSQSQSMAAAVQQLQEQVRELRAAVAEVRSEAAQYRAETGELRRELQATRNQLAPQAGVGVDFEHVDAGVRYSAGNDLMQRFLPALRGLVRQSCDQVESNIRNSRFAKNRHSPINVLTPMHPKLMQQLAPVGWSGMSVS